MSNIDKEIKRTDDAWWVYMVRCSDDSLYTGCTTDLQRRVQEHNGKSGRGAKYTASRRPVFLSAAVQVVGRSAAQKLEYALKSMTRANKILWCANNGVSV